MSQTKSPLRSWSANAKIVQQLLGHVLILLMHTPASHIS
jgi:hypothetical protein